MKINRFPIFVIGLFLATALTLSCSVASTTAALGVSTGASSRGGKKETIVYNQPPQTQQQQPVIIYQTASRQRFNRSSCSAKSEGKQ